MELLILRFALAVVTLMYFRRLIISEFKIGYYEQKLENRNVDISKIKDIDVIGILKL